MNVTGALRPSPTRCAISTSAASSPNATPRRSARPSGTRASESAYAASSAARADGEYVTRTLCAAATAAACDEAWRGARAWKRYGAYRPSMPPTAL